MWASTVSSSACRGLRDGERLGVPAGDLDDDERVREVALLTGVEADLGAVEGRAHQDSVDPHPVPDAGVRRDTEGGEVDGCGTAGPQHGGRHDVDGDDDHVGGHQRVEEPDDVEPRADDVATRGECRAVDRDADHGIRGERLVAGAQVRAEVEDVVVGALGVEDEEAVLAVGEVDGDDVVAEAGVEPGGRPDAGPAVGAVDDQGVGAGAGPDPDAVGERPVGGRPVGDAGRGEADDEHLTGCREVGVPCGRRGGVVGDEDGGARGAVTLVGALVADEEGVPSGPEVEVEGALDRVEVAGQELGAPVDRHVGLRGDVDAVVPDTERHVRHRERPAHVEDVVARAQGEVERLEPLVGDAVAARGVGGRGAGAEGVEADRHRVGLVLVHLAAEADEVPRTDGPDVDARRAPGVAGNATGEGDAGVRHGGLREEEQLEGRADLLGARPDG